MAACPYCGVDLKVMLKRKKACASCGQTIYVKSTPDNREKRLMTETQAAQAERQWGARYPRQSYVSMLSAFGLQESDLDVECLHGTPTDSAAMIAILERISASSGDLHKRKMAFFQLATIANKEERPSLEYLKEAVRCQLLGFSDGIERGFIVGLEIPKPRPWPPAVRILELHSQGLDVDSIAGKVGYSKYTVERAIRTRGMDWRTGEQCSRHAGRVFSIAEAMLEMPLPCGPRCICGWRPLFRAGRIDN